MTTQRSFPFRWIAIRICFGTRRITQTHAHTHRYTESLLDPGIRNDRRCEKCFQRKIQILNEGNVAVTEGGRWHRVIEEWMLN